jgi:hypothetical protein
MVAEWPGLATVARAWLFFRLLLYHVRSLPVHKNVHLKISKICQADLKFMPITK